MKEDREFEGKFESLTYIWQIIVKLERRSGLASPVPLIATLTPRVLQQIAPSVPMDKDSELTSIELSLNPPRGAPPTAKPT